MPGADSIINLDVRPYLRKKLEPFQLIMDTVSSVSKDQILLLHATFKPTPLLGLLKMKGYSNRVEMIKPDHWITAFAHKSMGKEALETIDFSLYADLEEGEAVEPLPEEPDCSRADPEAGEAIATAAPEAETAGRVTELDNRGLEPPQPMVRTLKALEKCSPGDKVVIHNDRVPMFLIEELKQLGYPYSIEDQADGSAKVTISKT
jgi:uncharacterized protein (DUF2249 family)